MLRTILAVKLLLRSMVYNGQGCTRLPPVPDPT